MRLPLIRRNSPAITPNSTASVATTIPESTWMMPNSAAMKKTGK